VQPLQEVIFGQTYAGDEQFVIVVSPPGHLPLEAIQLPVLVPEHHVQTPEERQLEQSVIVGHAKAAQLVIAVPPQVLPEA